MIKAIIFDFDGLLVNSEELREMSLTQFLKNYGKKFDVGDYPSLMTKSREETTKFLKEKYQLEGRLEDLTKQRYVIFKKLFEDRLALMDGVSDFLERVKNWNVKCAVASGRHKEQVLDGIKRLGIADLFDVVVNIDEVSRGKPDPEIFLLCAKKLNIEPKNCLALEDSPHGLESAKAAGMKVVYVPSVKYFDANHPDADVILKTLHDLGDEVIARLHKL